MVLGSRDVPQRSEMRRPTRVGLIGDVHGEAANLSKAVRILRGRELVDCIVCVGDIVDGGTSVDDCCDILLANDVLAVRGNHDRWILSGQMRSVRGATSLDSLRPRSRRFLASLPALRVVDVANGRVVVAHGVAYDDMRGLPRFPDDRLVRVFRQADVIRPGYIAMVSGHSHRRFSTRIAGISLIGLATLHSSKATYCGVFDAADQTVEFHRL